MFFPIPIPIPILTPTQSAQDYLNSPEAEQIRERDLAESRVYDEIGMGRHKTLESFGLHVGITKDSFKTQKISDGIEVTGKTHEGDDIEATLRRYPCGGFECTQSTKTASIDRIIQNDIESRGEIILNYYDETVEIPGFYKMSLEEFKTRSNFETVMREPNRTLRCDGQEIAFHISVVWTE